MAMKFEIVCESSKGAKLVFTESGKATWLQGRFIREDGTLTKKGIESLENAEMTIDEAKVKYETLIRRSGMTKEEIREELLAESRVPMSVTIKKENIKDHSDKCFKIKTYETYHQYGRTCHTWCYVPKRLVRVDYVGKFATLTLPKWLVRKNKILVESNAVIVS